MYSHFLQPGTLVRITHKPTDSRNSRSTSFWCESVGSSCNLDVGTIVIIVHGSKKSAIGNPLVHFMHQNIIYSIVQYNDQRGKPLWCDIVQNIGDTHE